MNPILLTDAYNLSHHILKKNVDWEISHVYNRHRSMILNGFSEAVCKILNTKIEVDMVDEAEEYATKMGMPFPSDMWYELVNHLKGRIPLHVQALPDGSYVPKGTPFARITNTEEGFGELVSWYEPLYLHTAFDSGCATRAYEMLQYLKDNDLPLHRLHSFGFRGHNSYENAVKAGKAWRLCLPGTDDFHTQEHTDGKGQSILATAHKTIQQFDEEMEAYCYSIDETNRAGFNIVAIVIDTYDPIRFIKYYSKRVAEYAKHKNVTVVFRPDSGDVKAQAFALYTLMHAHGLLKDTSCIIGEGMTLVKVKEYDKYFKDLGCDLNWFSYGIGAGYYKDIDRDYLGFAMKTSYSNGANRMKFSADRIKESLPGDINLFREANLIVAGYGHRSESLYVDIYNYDARSWKPYSKIFKWEEIKDNLQNQITDTNQEEIIIDTDIRQERERLHKKYMEHVAS